MIGSSLFRRNAAALAACVVLAACDGASLPNIASNVSLPNFGALLNLASISKASVGDELLVADALTGERCRIRKTSNGGDLDVENFVVLCAGWTQPAGWLRRFDADPDIELSRLLDDPALVLWQPGSAQCETTSISVDGVNGDPIALRECTTTDGWPMFAWAARGAIDARIGAYVGYGLPQLATLVEPLLGGTSELVQGGSSSALVERARAQASAGGTVVSLDDIMNFRQLVRLGLAHNQSGEFADAARAYERALAIKAKGQGGSDVFAAPLEAAWGLNLASDGRELEATAAFANAAEDIDKIAWSDAYPTYQGYLAAQKRRLGELDEAADLAREATNRRAALFGGDSAPVAASRLLEAGIARDRAQIVEARNLMALALGGFERAREPVGQSFVKAAQAELELAAGNPAAARDHASDARNLMFELFGEGRNLAEAALTLGAAEAALGNQDAALDAFREAFRAADKARFEQSYLTPEDLEPYLDLLFAAAAADPADAGALFTEALSVSQVPRRTTIERSLRRMSARLSADNPQLRDLVEKYETKQQLLSDTRNALTRLRLGVEDAAQGSSEAELEARIADLKNQLVEDEAWLQRQHPRYGNLVAPGVIDAAAAASLLQPGEAFVRILSGANATYTLVVHPDGRIDGNRSTMGRDHIAQAVAELRQALTFATGLNDFDTNLATRLYASLFGNLLDDGVDHLLVTADGALLSLPFEVLPTQPGLQGDYANAAWLGRDMAVSYVFSLSRA